MDGTVAWTEPPKWKPHQYCAYWNPLASIISVLIGSAVLMNTCLLPIMLFGLLAELILRAVACMVLTPFYYFSAIAPSTSLRRWITFFTLVILNTFLTTFAIYLCASKISTAHDLSLASLALDVAALADDSRYIQVAVESVWKTIFLQTFEILQETIIVAALLLELHVCLRLLVKWVWRRR